MNARSERNLKTCHIDLQNLFNEIDTEFPLVIVEGHRSLARQLYLWAIGRSENKEGKHNENPSEACDVYPEPIDWKDGMRMYYFAGYIRAKAEAMKIKLRWGGDWDGDTEVKDQDFNDLGHFELVNK